MIKSINALFGRLGLAVVFGLAMATISTISQAAEGWTSIDIEDSRLDVAGTVDFVDAVRVRQSVTIYEELWNVPGGFLHYQAPTPPGNGANQSDRFAAPALARQFTLILNAVGAPVGTRIEQDDLRRSGTFFFATTEVAESSCLVFNQPFSTGGDGAASIGEQILTGLVCRPNLSPAAVTALTFGILARLSMNNHEILGIDAR